MKRPYASDAVATAFATLPASAQPGLSALRNLIFEVAQDLPQVGRIEEALRWGQPSYLTPETKSGTTIRLGVPQGATFGLFVHCRTSLITSHARHYPGLDRYDKTRGILFDAVDDIDPVRHGDLIARALCYHL